MNFLLNGFSGSLPDGYEPSIVVALGPQDSQEALSVGLALAKQKTHQFQRTITVTVIEIPAGLSDKEAIELGINRVVQSSRGRVTRVQDVELQDLPAREVDYNFDGPDALPLRVKACVFLRNGRAHALSLTSLNQPKTEKEIETHFRQLLDELKFY